ncbi:hypothetical protein B0T24DRAFT_598800 [Lasiosphaeria ovina]|uniref:Uncharacterized protein n=1 Tax=Lasiosphaeria ovina TaxID=92902 RepID=A0AAE0JUS7_9PEZI|nr:hypothetical protein B0T24DRAFT_598800 [Lasiosphaeria ovina]
MRLSAVLQAFVTVFSVSVAIPAASPEVSGASSKSSTTEPLISNETAASLVDKPQTETYSAYLWTTGCTGEHYTWTVTSDGCFAYYFSGSQVRDMYSVHLSGECAVYFYSSSKCNVKNIVAGQHVYSQCVANGGNSFKSFSTFCF